MWVCLGAGEEATFTVTHLSGHVFHITLVTRRSFHGGEAWMPQLRVPSLPALFAQLETTARCSIHLTPLHRQVVVHLLLCWAFVRSVLGMQFLCCEDNIAFEACSEGRPGTRCRGIHYLHSTWSLAGNTVVLEVDVRQVVREWFLVDHHPREPHTAGLQ